MKRFVEAEIKVTKFEYENLMNVDISDPTSPEYGGGGDVVWPVGWEE